MLKVICVDSKPSNNRYILDVKEGVIYEVWQSPVFKDSYCVKGLEIHSEDGHRAHYLKYRFVPLSNIDETELIKERQEYV